jgi:hypothetical protein
MGGAPVCDDRRCYGTGYVVLDPVTLRIYKDAANEARASRKDGQALPG